MSVKGKYSVDWGQFASPKYTEGSLSQTEIAQLVAWRHGFNDLDLDQHADGKDAVMLKAYGPNRSLTVRGSNTEEVVEKLLQRLEGTG